MPITMKPEANTSLVSESAMHQKWAWIALFTSSTTLICCAIPILLVSLGLGAVSASLFANLPILVTLAQHKAWMFTGSGAVLMLTAWLLFRPGRACPTDPDLAKMCESAHRWSTRFFWASATIWVIGFAAAYLALPIYLWLGND
ncbi:MAG: hypothetical protein ACE5OQ_05435 [Woeseia sp.]